MGFLNSLNSFCCLCSLIGRSSCSNRFEIFHSPAGRAHIIAPIRTTPMTRTETEGLFDRHFDAMRRHDLDALIVDYAEDCVVESPIAGQVRGRAAIDNTNRSFLASFP